MTQTQSQTGRGRGFKQHAASARQAAAAARRAVGATAREAARAARQLVVAAPVQAAVAMQATGIANQQQPQQPPQPQANQVQQPPQGTVVQQPAQGVAPQQQQQAQQPAPQGQQQGQQPQPGAQPIAPGPPGPPGPGAAANMAAQNPPNFIFALSPALINQGPIDYSTAKGIKLWRGAIKPLAKELFTLEAHRFKLFLSTLTERTMVYGWENILNIPVDAAVQAGATHLLLTHYGQVTLQQVKDHAATYLNTQTRAAQNNILLCTCLAHPSLQRPRQRQ